MTDNYDTLTQYGWSIFDASVKPALVLCNECTNKENENRRQLLLWQTLTEKDMPKSTTTTTESTHTMWVNPNLDKQPPLPKLCETIVVYDDGTRELIYFTELSQAILIKQLEDRYEEGYEQWTRLVHYVGEVKHLFVALIDDIHHLA